MRKPDVFRFIDKHPRLTGLGVGLALTLLAVSQYERVTNLAAAGEQGPAIFAAICGLAGIAFVATSPWM